MSITAILLIVGGIYLFAKSQALAPTPTQPNTLEDSLNDASLWSAPSTSKVLIAYGAVGGMLRYIDLANFKVAQGVGWNKAVASLDYQEGEDLSKIEMWGPGDPGYVEAYGIEDF